MSTNSEMKCLFLTNAEIRDKLSIIKNICDILIDNNLNFYPSLFERIEKGSTLEEKVYNRIYEKIESNYNYIIVYAKDGVVGFSEIKVDFVDIHSSKVRAAVVGTSAVSPAYHGKGVVKELYDEIEIFAGKNKVESIVRTTWSKNQKQLALYSKYGYEEYQREENARGEGNHLIIFKKDLKYTV